MSTDRECLQTVAQELAAVQNIIAAQLGTTPPNPEPTPPPTDPTSPHGYPNHGTLYAGASGQGGTQVHHNGPANYSYLIPEVAAGTKLEVTVASGTHATSVRVYDPSGVLCKDQYGLPSEGTMPAGAGGIRAVASVAGTYVAEVEGGDEITTVNHKRA